MDHVTSCSTECVGIYIYIYISDIFSLNKIINRIKTHDSNFHFVYPYMGKYLIDLIFVNSTGHVFVLFLYSFLNLMTNE